MEDCAWRLSVRRDSKEKTSDGTCATVIGGIARAAAGRLTILQLNSHRLIGALHQKPGSKPCQYQSASLPLRITCGNSSSTAWGNIPDELHGDGYAQNAEK